MATMSIEQMRSVVSVLYQGNWADRVQKMPDKQVVAIFQRNLDKKRTTLKKESN